MTEPDQARPATRVSKHRRLLLQMLVGALLGASVTYGALTLIRGNVAIFDEPQRLVAMAVGLVFLLMGAFVVLGTAMPRPGSVLLNVEDEEELRERSPDLRNSALMCGLVGIILLTLSVTATGDTPGLLDAGVGRVMLAIALIALTITSFAMRDMGDELDKAISNEASALAMHASSILFGGWGILSYLGYVP